ncbi:MAG TPA: pantoate--beta-alanine ligase [Syntrophomonadaceae bacterium]|nr:pantoate--beta-alanine ligase [Syntrophomonadaceae bacterium]
MEIFYDLEGMQKWCLNHKLRGKKIGLVPTMGYLHAGHLALVKEAGIFCDIVVVSIFVNPLQFGQGEDFSEYPRDLSQDISLLEAEKVQAVFAPQARDMYPLGYNTFLEVTGSMTDKLCGKSRPGHFRGVTTVVGKLFNICQPDLAFFGQKDIQQLIIIEKMVREFNFPLEIIRVPIVRENDGLAISSRNVYLSKPQREASLILNKALQLAKKLIADGERKAEVLRQKLTSLIESEQEAFIDYIGIVDEVDLANLSDLTEAQGKVIVALAVKIGNTRLIDNLLVEV